MTTTPTFWISDTYRFRHADGSVDVLALPSDGFQVDLIENRNGRLVFDDTNTVTPFGDDHHLSKRFLASAAIGVDVQTDLLSNGQVGSSYIRFPNGGPGVATAFVDNLSERLSDSTADCYAMFESVGLADGGLISLWGQTVGGAVGREVAFRRVGNQGQLLGEPTEVPSESGHEQTAGIMTQLAGGTIVIGWDDAVFGATTVDVMVQRYSALGSALGDPVAVGAHAAGAATAIHALDGGGFVVAWDDAAANQSTLQLFADDGSTLGDPITTTGDLTGAITALHDGGFALGITVGGAEFVQRFGADGAAIGDAVAGGGELATLDDGRFVVANQFGYTIYDPRDFVIAGTAGNNVIYGRLDGSEIAGMQGNDTLTGSNASDIIRGGDGDDKIQGLKSDDQLFGSAGTDTIGGGRGMDMLDGGAGDDSLNGSYDDDTLLGAAGADTLRGGSGADVFVYQRTSESGADPSTRDTIVDFEVRRDRIDVHEIDADRLHAGQQSFTFIGSAEFTAVGQIRYEVQGGVTLVEADTNGDGQADLAIALSGAIALNASNFILTEQAGLSVGGLHPFLASFGSHDLELHPLLHLV